MSWARLIELLEAQEACLERQDFAQHGAALPEIERVLSALSDGPPPSDEQKERVESLLDGTLQSSLRRVARTGAALRHQQRQLAAEPPRLIDRKG